MPDRNAELLGGRLPKRQSQVRLLLADEQALFREAVRVLLGREPDLEVVAEARDGLEAVAEAQRTVPDVALLDAYLPNGDGLHATELIRERVPGCRVLVLGRQEDERTLAKALEAGASGYLTKESPLADLMEAVRAVYRGETLIPALMLGGLLESLIRRNKEHDEALELLARVSPREREVLSLLADGADNDAIAQNLVISPQTARTHVQNVLSKLGVHSRLEAAVFARRNGVSEERVSRR